MFVDLGRIGNFLTEDEAMRGKQLTMEDSNVLVGENVNVNMLMLMHHCKSLFFDVKEMLIVQNSLQIYIHYPNSVSLMNWPFRQLQCCK